MNTLVSKAASVALAVLLCRSVVATTCAYSQAPGVTIGITQINYIVYNAPVSTLDGALSIWMSGCNGQGSMYPSLSSTTATLQGPAIVNIGVSFQPGTSSHNTCGDSFMRYDSSGSLIGGTIIIFDHQVDGNGVQTPCASLTNFDAVIAHELGHTLGLADLYSIDPNSPGLCSGALMSDDPEELYPDECKVADSNFFTPAEDSGSQPPAGGGNPDGGCPYGAGGCVSPIVINLDRGAYHLTGANQNPVSFDINADGQPDVLGWTAAGFNEGFLAFDRNQNGFIDDGSELFGNYTLMRNGRRAPNGFAALAEFDENHDGVIDARDSIWSSLRLWVDVNHDGISQGDEILTLDEAGITSLSFDPHWTGRHDQYGNVFRYQAFYTQGKTRKPYYDIYFVKQP